MMYGRHRGFTLIEVLLAVAILVMVLGSAYMVLFSTIETREHIEGALGADRIGTRILAVVAADLRAVAIYRSEEDATFEAKADQGTTPQTLSVEFIATTRSVLPDGDRYSPINEVGYELEENQERPGFYRLFRREDFYVDDEPLAGGRRVLLHDMVQSFQLTFHGVKDDKPIVDKKEWVVKGDDTFPTRVDILLILAVPPAVEIEGQRLDEDDVEYHRFKTSVEIASREREESEGEEGKEGEEGETTGGSLVEDEGGGDGGGDDAGDGVLDEKDLDPNGGGGG